MVIFGYSEAEHHIARGAILVGIDHLGVEDSSLDLNKVATIEDVAEAADSVVRDIPGRIRSGSPRSWSGAGSRWAAESR